MSEEDKKENELDAFWDLSYLIPKQNHTPRQTQRIKTADISFSHPKTADTSESSTVIKRYIDPLHKEHKLLKKESFDRTETYVPNSSLLHSVTLKKRKSAYELYTDFFESAIRYQDYAATEAPYVSYYSYVPQYDQLSEDQLKYYLWWRQCFKNNVLIKVDISYVILYIYELINLGDAADLVVSRDMLVKMWNVYYKVFPSLSGKLAIWICDFCLLHRLDVPADIKSEVTAYVPSLKEFYINIPIGDLESCARSLLKYGTEYDYHISKFATDKNIYMFDKHIFGAILTAVKFFSRDGVVLSELTSEDSKLIRNAFEGALCISKWRYEIEVKYCSFSRSNELRFIMGDIVKYAENKIRGFLGIKSRLSVYSIGGHLQKALDTYFDEAFALERPVIVKKEEKHEYDALYDVPQKPLSLENARKIENDSWSTTNDLVSAFEEEEKDIKFDIEPVSYSITNTEHIKTNAELSDSLGRYLAFTLAVKAKDREKILKLSNELDMLPDAVVDTVNEIAVDIIGDIIIEDHGEGFEIVECYDNLI